MSKRVLVVGAGVVGLSTAYQAALRGHRVAVVERGRPEDAGCSFGNAGLVVPSHFVPLAAPGAVARALRGLADPESPFHLRPRLSGELLAWGLLFFRAASAERVARAAPLLRDLHLASRALYEEWARDWPSRFGYERSGLLVLCRTERGLDQEARAAQHARRLGLCAEVWDGRQTAEREDGLRLDVAGAVHYPDDARLLPERLMAALRARAEAAGVEIAWQTAVQGWRTSAGRVTALDTSGGERTADEYVLCAGAWSAVTARDLGLRLPLEAGRGMSLTLPNPPGRLRRGFILSEAHVAVTPMDGALRVGGTLELAGLEATVLPARVRGLVKAAVRYLPDLREEHFAGLRPWCGLRPCSPDGLPYLGRVRRFANLSVATGHALLGISLAPVTGRLMAEILSDEAPHLDVGALRPDRYHERSRS